MTFEDYDKKGKAAEAIVESVLRERGWSVYKETTGPHPLDGIAIQNAANTGKLPFCFEVKAKKRRRIHNDVGMDLRKLNKCIRLSQETGMECVWFVLETLSKTLYCAQISSLQKTCVSEGVTYPLTTTTIDERTGYNKEVVFFSLNQFKKIRDLTKEESLSFGL